MGTGVGEAALLQAMGVGAVTGAATSAVTGGDPLKGALLGAATSGVGAGVAGGASGAASQAAAPIVEGTTQAALQEAANQATQQTIQSGLQTATQALPGAGADAISSISGLPLDATGTASLTGAPVSGMGLTASPDMAASLYTPPPTPSPYSVGSTAMPSAAQASVTPTVTPPPPSGTPPTALEAFYAKNPIAVPAGLGALGSLIGAGPESNIPGVEKYSGPLSRFSYDPDKYRRAASGGLMDTTPARHMAGGGHLGSYSDGGQLLKGPGDGMSDDIPASIEGDQPALLADGEFVVPADVVSGLGNGSTDAGAKQLYAMMDAVRKARTGREEQAPEIDADKYMPA